ncbi:MAG: hypothetical protein JXB32_26045 [Deltaproteobacteria bacterium]|nr:hypothetical protein [Deltaproteobacteria bacterium]
MDRLVERLDGALRALGCEAEPAAVESWGALIREAMQGKARTFHTVEHLEEISQDAGPVETLAILFHDLVYVQVDRGVHETIANMVASAADHCGGRLTARAFDPAQDRPGALVALVFGVEPGRELTPATGLNEYFSALVAARLTATVLWDRDVARVVACIEATIPFRPADEHGDSPLDRLAVRLARANRELALGLTDEEVAAAVDVAAEVSHRDLGNFADPDPACFLDHTWRLLPESHEELRRSRSYTIRQYRVSLQQSEAFLAGLDPERIFSAVRGRERDPRLLEWRGRAARNLDVGVRYLRVKLFGTALLEALAEATGGDAAMGLFMGDLPNPERSAPRLEEQLPAVPEERQAPHDPVVRGLLLYGRAGETAFDLKTSPLSAHLYVRLGEAAVLAGAARARELFAGRLDPAAFLAGADAACVADVAEAAARTAHPRERLLLELAARFRTA